MNPKRNWRLWKMIRRGLLVFASLLVLLVLSGALWNALCDARDRRRFQPPGQLHAVDGLQLHLHCSGQGQPTVILDTGFSMPALGWVRVQPELAKRTRVCSYDRAGMGYSEQDPTRTPRPASLLAVQLHTLLHQAGESGPFILVGHSNGGYLVRAFHQRFASEVAGAVLVDSSSEYMDERFQQTVGKDWRAEDADGVRSARRMQPVVRFLQWTGIMRWQLTQAAKSQDFGLGPTVVAEAIFLLNQPKWYPATVAELAGVMATCEELRAGKNLGQLPLIVLTAGNFRPHGGPADEAMQKEWNRIWVHELQPQLARLSTRGRQVIADSGHLIPFEAPEAVVNAVLEVMQTAATAPTAAPARAARPASSSAAQTAP